MYIKSAEFTTSVINGNNFWSPNILQVAFYGRSNVGKSSTINALLNRNTLARSSSKPGKTTEANFYLINDDFYFVDLPGYGYARLGKDQRTELQDLINWYINTNIQRRVHVLILDAKVGLTDLDREHFDKLTSKTEPIIIIINKIDKLNQKDTSLIFRQIAEKVGSDVKVLTFSATTKKGVEKFWQEIELINQKYENQHN